VTRVRLSRSATITRTQAGILLRSDLGTFQITGADAGTFLAKLAPLLDGSRDRDAISAALAGYSPASVGSFLDMLAVRGLLEDVPDREEHRRGQLDFRQRWSADGPGASKRLDEARVLVAGAEPWGEVAARELATAGIGAIDRFDGSVREPERSLVVAALSAGDGVEIERIATAAHRAACARCGRTSMDAPR
jgi:molybdopterin-synthase adenylyltransferase